MTEQFYDKNIEYNNSYEITKNIISKDTFELNDFKVIEKISPIKKIPNWSKIYWRNKRNILLKEKINKNNLIDYWLSNTNIFANENVNKLLAKLKLDKYIYNKHYFLKAYPDCEYPLLDEYESYKNKTFCNKSSSLISKLSLFNSNNQNSINNNTIPIISNKDIKINIAQEEAIFEEEYENSFIEDVNKFADEYENNDSYNN